MSVFMYEFNFCSSSVSPGSVPPTLSAWIEHGDKMVAVCKAERGKPAANISWSHSHSRASRSEETLESDGSITVESRLELDEGTDTENLTCVVRHPSWEEEKTLVAKLKGQAAQQEETNDRSIELVSIRL